MTDEQKLTELGHEFVTRLRAHVNRAAEAEPDVAIERLISVGTVVVAAVLMVMPGKNRDTLVFSLLATAARHFIKGPSEPPVHLVR